MARCDLDRLFEAVARQQVKTADRFLRLGERAVRYQRLAVAHSYGAGSTWRCQLIACQPDPSLPEVVDPRKALFLGGCELFRVRVGLAIHVLRVPADQQ